MPDSLAPWWVTVAGSFAGGSFIALFQVAQWWFKRHDDVDVQHTKTEAQREEIIDRETSAHVARLVAEIDRQAAVIERFRRRESEIEADRQAGWEAAYFWVRHAWRMQNEAAYARQLEESRRRYVGEEPKIWPGGDIDLPPFNGPRPRNPHDPNP